MSEQRLSREELDTLRSYCLGHVEHSGDDATIVGVCDTALSLDDENERLRGQLGDCVRQCVDRRAREEAALTEVATLREALEAEIKRCDPDVDDLFRAGRLDLRRKGFREGVSIAREVSRDNLRAALAATPGTEEPTP